MFLNRLILRDFKNIAAADTSFSPKVNCIYGSNGAGKTNLLDAIYYLSMTKSYFSSSDQYVYAYGSEEATLCGFYQMDGGTEEKISAAVRRGGEKIFRRGAKPYARFSEHIGLLPVVMVSPLDATLVNDAGEERRKYLNFILSQIDREYLRHIQSYNQLLLQRNKLLKSDIVVPLLLDTLSERMAPHAAYVYNARKNLCEQLRPMIQDFYSRLSQGKEIVDLSYRSDLDDASLEELFSREAEKERVLRYTTAGVQRDDLLFRLDGHPAGRAGRRVGHLPSYSGGHAPSRPRGKTVPRARHRPGRSGRTSPRSPSPGTAGCRSPGSSGGAARTGSCGHCTHRLRAAPSVRRACRGATARRCRI